MFNTTVGIDGTLGRIKPLLVTFQLTFSRERLERELGTVATVSCISGMNLRHDLVMSNSNVAVDRISFFYHRN